MKKYLTVLFVLCLLSVSSYAKDCGNKYFNVTSEAEVLVQPDSAKLTFGISMRTKTLEDGKNKMKKTLDKAYAFCGKKGIKRKYIQLNNINISPFYYNREVCPQGGGKCHDEENLRYGFNQTFTITLNNLSNYEQLLYGLLELGVNQVENVEFYAKDLRKYKDEARLLAISNAKEKAKLLSEASGIKLGKIVNVRENIPQTVPFRAVSSAANVVQNSYGTALGQGEAVGAGQIKVKSEITLTYKL